MPDEYTAPPSYTFAEPGPTKRDPSHHDLATTLNKHRWRNILKKRTRKRKKQKQDPRAHPKFY